MLRAFSFSGMTLRVYLSLQPEAASVCVPREINWYSLGMTGIGSEGPVSDGSSSSAVDPLATWIATGVSTGSGQDGQRLSRVLAGFLPVLSRIGFVPLGTSLSRLIGEIDKSGVSC
jgi:hypothetical protein